MQWMPSVNWTGNGVLSILKSTIKITNMKLHEENKLGSMQNYKERAHRDARFLKKKMKEVRELNEIWCSKVDQELRELRERLTVNQLTVQIQELQYRRKFLNDARCLKD